MFHGLIYYVGLAGLAYMGWSFASFFYTFIRPSSMPRYLHGEKGTCWALVTGASDGIGLGYSEELLSRGFNVILHGRNKKKLEGIQERLNRSFPTRLTRLLVLDVIHSTPEDMEAQLNNIKDLRVTVLINNVGGPVPGIRPFESLQDLSATDADNLLDLNARFTVQVARFMLPTLIRNQPSLMLNLSSIAAWGLPWAPVYSGSKAFILGFSESLQASLQGDGLDVKVHGIMVGKVSSGGYAIDTNFWAPTSSVFAKATLDTVGRSASQLTPYLSHALQLCALPWLPTIIRRPLITVNARAARQWFIETSKEA